MAAREGRGLQKSDLTGDETRILVSQTVIPTRGKFGGAAPIRAMGCRMSGLWFAVALASLSVASCTVLTPFHDDSHYVPLGPRTGYYIVRPGSALSHQLGIDSAPTIDTADPFRHGYGADVLAFDFNRAGFLSAPPAYIVQGTPNEFYMRRIGSLIRGQNSEHDVRVFFGRSQSTERRADGFIAYYTIEVYDPFQDRSGTGRR
jgi:hypothetical protein